MPDHKFSQLLNDWLYNSESNYFNPIISRPPAQSQPLPSNTPISMIPRQFSYPIYPPNSNSTVHRQLLSLIYSQNASLPNTSSIVPENFSKQTTPHSQCFFDRLTGGTSGNNISTELSHSTLNTGRSTAPLISSSRRYNTQIPTPLPCRLSKGVISGGILGDASTEIRRSSSDVDTNANKNDSAGEKSMSGTSSAPIEIPDSPNREKSVQQHDQSQRRQRAKRAREEKSEVDQICSDPVHKTKKPKLVAQQSETQTIIINNRPPEQDQTELPSVQTDNSGNTTNHVAECTDHDDVQIQSEKDLLPEDFEVQERESSAADGFSCWEESMDDFVGLEDIGKFAIYSVWDRMVFLNDQLAANSASY